MAYSIYLRIDGIPGESTARGHENEMVISSYNWGLQDAISAGGTGGGAVASKVKFSGLNVIKRVDKASPKLMLACATGRHIPGAALSFVRKNGQQFLLYEFADVQLPAVQDQGAAQGEATPTEAISLTFGGVRVTYRPENADGSLGTPEVFQWDVKSGTAG